MRLNESPLRVLIIAHGHPELSPGGAEIAAYDLFMGLKRARGVEPVFLAWRDDPRGGSGKFLEFAERADEILFHSEAFDPFLYSQRCPKTLAAFDALLDRLRPDVLHFHHYVHIGFEFVAIARRRRPAIRIILTLHEFLAICHNHGVMVRRSAEFTLCFAGEPAACARCFPDRPAEAFVARRASILSNLSKIDLIVSPSRFVRDRYVAWGVPGWQIVVLENAIPALQAPPPRRRAATTSPNVFGYFGQIHPYKGLLQLLSAFREIGASRDDRAESPRLIVHGAYLDLNDAAYVNAFNEVIAACGTRVEFAGRYHRSDLRGLLAAVDWVVVPSIWWENSPLVIEEALAHKRPVLCSDIGGMREKVRSGEDGVHFKVGDPRALATQILRLSRDDALWRRLRRTMRRPTTIDASVERHVRIYRDRMFYFG